VPCFLFALLLHQVRHSAQADRIDDAVAKGVRSQFAEHRKRRSARHRLDQESGFDIAAAIRRHR
jgi:hypothetical protein